MIRKGNMHFLCHFLSVFIVTWIHSGLTPLPIFYSNLAQFYPINNSKTVWSPI